MKIHALLPQPAGDGTWSLPGSGEANRWLAGLGLRAGDRVALAGLNHPGSAQALEAGLRSGLTLVLLNRRLHPQELSDQLARAACSHLIADPGHPAALQKLATVLPTDFSDHGHLDGPLRGSLVVYTSGSSGQSKAVRLEAPALTAATAAHVAALGLTADSVWSCPLPIDHIGGAMCVLRALVSGCRVQLHERFDAQALSADLDAAATGVSVVPTMLHRVLEVRSGRPWQPRLRRVLTGGGPVPASVVAACAAHGLFPSQTYGLSEMASMVTVLDPADGPAHPGSAGRCVPGARLRIQNGRIQVAGAMLCAGIENSGQLIVPAKGWLTTDDLGELSPDGFLTVHGRTSELIVSGGENVSAREVEAVLEKHPAVSAAAVVGVADAEWGEAVAAMVVLGGTVTVDELTTHCLARLAKFKLPRHWRVVAELPRSGAGKLRRGEVQRMFLEPDKAQL